eukprot:SAG31_NODE_4364_length_3308_cov_1.969773_1_plen_81_part_00
MEFSALSAPGGRAGAREEPQASPRSQATPAKASFDHAPPPPQRELEPPRATTDEDAEDDPCVLSLIRPARAPLLRPRDVP